LVTNYSELFNDINPSDHGIACTKDFDAEEIDEVFGITLNLHNVSQIHVSVANKLPVMNSSMLSTTFYRQPRTRNQDDKSDGPQDEILESLRFVIRGLIEVSSRMECFQASRMRNIAQFTLDGELTAEAISGYLDDAHTLPR
jgi:hypothetical protein